MRNRLNFTTFVLLSCRLSLACERGGVKQTPLWSLVAVVRMGMGANGPGDND